MGLSGARVLVLDMDPQGFLTRTMDVEEPEPDTSVAALFHPQMDLGLRAVRSMNGFDLIPSSSTLTKRMRDLNKPTDVLWVRETLQSRDLDYDVVLFDTAAAVTVYSLNALVASKHVVIPVLPEYQAVVGAEQTYQTATLVQNKLNPMLQSCRFLFTQVDARKRIHRTYQQYMREKYGEAVMESIIRTSTSLAESREGGTTVYDHDPHTRGAKDYANATDELLRHFRRDEDDGDTDPATPAETVRAEDVPLPNEVMNR